MHPLPAQPGATLTPAGLPATPAVGHVYLDLRRRVLHCLNATAHQLYQQGLPFLPADLAARPLFTADGRPVDAVDLPLFRARRDGQPVEAAFDWRRENGPTQRVTWTATPVRDAAGQMVGVVGTITVCPPEPDWSTLAGMAHDLRTPLQALKLLTALLDGPVPVPDELREVVERFRTSAERALGISQDLLEWCRGPVAGRRGEQAWFALEPFLAALAAEQAVSARQKSLALLTQLEPARGWETRADRVRLGRLLANLLTNAIRYTERGRVRFTAAWQEAGGPDRSLVLTVEDTGSGISPEEQESIFQPFERGRAGKETDSGGSGMGLAVVDRLVEELGLSLEVYSEYGHGSAFHLTLPPSLLRPVADRGSGGPTPKTQSGSPSGSA